jgi:DNA-binding winged helix-turn-helix (wHTH) protein/tetratricopeptide (TPR) repeat protein
MPHSPRFEFGPFQLDLNDRLLTRAGEVISLRPKATEILVRLVMNAGQLIKRDELLKEVWPDTFVEESNLSQTIFTLRKALGDDHSEPRYIETVPRRGYRFVAAVRDEQAKQQGEALHAASTASITQHQVVAVLPFLNQTGNPEFDYLADGITYNLINNLSSAPKLRVMSQSVVDRYRMEVGDPQKAGQELHAHAVLVGRLHCRHIGISVDVELIDPATGWQLWGQTFDSEKQDRLHIQNEITQQVLANLRLKLIGDEEKRVMARYTESTEAYHAYLEGRQHWSSHTRKSLEIAIGHFRRAIILDPNYALAYAAIIDSYLRLATNYLPPEEDLTPSLNKRFEICDTKPSGVTDDRVALRFEWDTRGVERELRRANDLKTAYPGAHQWYFAYQRCKRLYEDSISQLGSPTNPQADIAERELVEALPPQIASLKLTQSEQLQVLCAIARDQVDVGNYEAGYKILQPWWSFGNSPRIDGLNPVCCADLLLTAGQVASFVASSVQLSRGQRHAEQLLNGSITLFEQLGFAKRAIEGRIALAFCFHRQGLFDLANSTLVGVLEDLTEENRDLRSLALMRLGSLERNAGRVKDALARLIQATHLAESSEPWMKGRCYLELASIHKDLTISEALIPHFDQAMDFYVRAIDQFAVVGHYRCVAIAENNIGLLLLGVKSYEESEQHLLRARRMFEALSDNLRSAEANDTLARLYIDTRNYSEARQAIDEAIAIFELADGEMILAEALITSAILAVKQQQHSLAKKNFEAACSIAERCGDYECAGRALLIMFEELSDRLEPAENIEVVGKMKRLLATTQQTNLLTRIAKCFDQVGDNKR